MLGEQLDAGTAGWSWSACPTWSPRSKPSMTKAEKIERRELQADTDELGKAVGSD